MKNSELVDIPLLVKRLQKEGKSAFGCWKNTAQEVCPDQHRHIQIIYSCYADLQPDELSDFRYESFIEAILDAIPTVEDKKRFLWFEALQEKKF